LRTHHIKDDLCNALFKSYINNSFSVNDFARIHFNGGGHRNAAGGEHYDSLENTIEYFLCNRMRVPVGP